MKKITDKLMETIVTYMDDEIRERVHFELAPCSNEEFLKRYIELDEGFKELLHDEFNIELEEKTTMKSKKYFIDNISISKESLYNIYKNSYDYIKGKSFDEYIKERIKENAIKEVEENSYYFSEDNRESLPELMDRTFTQSQLAEIYRDIVDKAEYQTFEDWLIDMLRTGLVIEYK